MEMGNKNIISGLEHILPYTWEVLLMPLQRFI